MMGLHPFDTFGFGHPQPRMAPRHVRAPPRHPATSVHNAPARAQPQPSIDLKEEADLYLAHIKSPEDGYELHDVRATLDGDGDIVVQGRIVKKVSGVHEYITRRRAGVFAEPDERALIGMLPPGQRVAGGEPTRSGWIALDDDESWMLDDGSLALVSRPTPARPTTFAKRVSLPADAELRHARIQKDKDGSTVITVPRIRRHAATARQVPINVKRSAVPQPTQTAASKKPAPKMASQPAATKTAPGPKATTSQHSSAEEYKQAHKQRVADRRDLAAELAALHGVAYDGPVLSECDVSSRNVQSPTESVEEWTATLDGGFAREGEDVDMITPSLAHEQDTRS